MNPSDDPKTSPQSPPVEAEGTDTSPQSTAPDSILPVDGIGIRFGPPAAPGEIGMLGRFRIVKELGRGGMGAVYLALDTRLQREVALKVMLPDAASNQIAKDRFIREARSAARINHDNVIGILDADELNGVPYIALPYLHGYPLDQFLKKRGNPSILQALRIGREMAYGLAAAHELGIVHRDIKPGNIWLETPQGRVKILDFGLAKPQEDKGSELTNSGAVMGTPAYMAPEQAAGHKVDHRADLYSLGTVLYRLVAGRTPFERSGGVMAILTALAIEPPPRVEDVNPQVPPALADLIHQLLEKDRERRPQSAKEVAQRLVAIRESRASATEGQFTPPGPFEAPQYTSVPMTAAPEDNAFAAFGTDEPTEREPRRKDPTDVVPSLSNRRPLVGLLAGGALFIAVGIFALVKMLGGPEKPPPGPEAKAPAKETAPKPPTPRPTQPKTVTPVDPSTTVKYENWQPVKDFRTVTPAPKGPLDDLDRSKLPTTELPPDLPKEVVAIAGSHAGSLEGTYALSADGKRLATFGPHTGVRIYDADTFKLRLWDRDFNSASGSPVASPDGRWFGVAVEHRTGVRGVRLYDQTSADPRARRDIAHSASNGYVQSMAFTADGKRLITGYDRGTVRVWDLEGPADAPAVTIENPDLKIVYGLAVSTDGKTVAARIHTADFLNRIHIWDLAGNAAVLRCRLPESENPWSFVLAKDGKRIVAGNDVKLTLWNVAGPSPVVEDTVAEPWFPVSLVSGGKDEFLGRRTNNTEPRIWSFGTKLEKGRELPPTTMAVSGDGGRLVQHIESVHRIRDAANRVVSESGESFASAQFSPAIGRSVHTFFPAAKALAWTAADGALKPGSPFAAFSPPVANFLSPKVSPDGKAIAGLVSGVLVAFAIDGAQLRPLTASAHGPIANFAWSPDSKSIVLLSDQNALFRWNPRDPDEFGEKLLDLGYPIGIAQPPLAVSPDGALVALVGQRGLELVNVSNPKRPRRTLVDLGNSTRFYGIAFSPGNRFLLMPRDSEIVRIDLSASVPVPEVVAKDPAAQVVTFQLSSDGRIAVTSGANYQYLQWWDTATVPFKLLGQWRTNFPTLSVGLAHDGRHLMVEQYGAVYVLRLAAVDPPRR